ncbi:HalOD1 output domain-containing protein [Halomicroarcula sp. GCM10025324]|jgi:hypothetical protein|uniref:HalOD1 output domain-containing protein n=1 Tax=Haloarcula TaxID=2237 RepID=UPI0023E7A642|nr:HalOD1 output domain-containing protein [Halomicroarcula sp. ZS-22-S1]
MTDTTLVYRPSPNETLSDTVVRAVADVKDVDPLDLDARVYDAVDPDALDRLFTPTGDGSAREGMVAFPMAGCRVEVQSDHAVRVTPPQADRLSAEVRA